MPIGPAECADRHVLRVCLIDYLKEKRHGTTRWGLERRSRPRPAGPEVRATVRRTSRFIGPLAAAGG